MKLCLEWCIDDALISMLGVLIFNKISFQTNTRCGHSPPSENHRQKIY